MYSSKENYSAEDRTGKARYFCCNISKILLRGEMVEKGSVRNPALRNAEKRNEWIIMITKR